MDFQHVGRYRTSIVIISNVLDEPSRTFLEQYGLRGESLSVFDTQGSR